MPRILEPEFFNRPTPLVAEELIGKFLIREYDGHLWTLMITEVEAFDGPEDKASHAHTKGRSEHTEPLFAHAGTLYVHLFNDLHWMLNVVTGPRDYPAAILIRSALIMLPTGEIEHIDDPALLTRFLRIGNEFNALEAGTQTGLWFEDRDIVIPTEHIVRKQRVGIDYAAEWNEALYNFSVEVARNKAPESA